MVPTDDLGSKYSNGVNYQCNFPVKQNEGSIAADLSSKKETLTTTNTNNTYELSNEQAGINLGVSEVRPSRISEIDIEGDIANNLFISSDYEVGEGEGSRKFNYLTRQGQKTPENQDVVAIAPKNTDLSFKPIATLLDISTSSAPGLVPYMKKFPSLFNHYIAEVSKVSSSELKDKVNEVKKKIPYDTNFFVDNDSPQASMIKIALIEALKYVANQVYAADDKSLGFLANGVMSAVLEDENNYYTLTIGDTSNLILGNNGESLSNISQPNYMSHLESSSKDISIRNTEIDNNIELPDTLSIKSVAKSKLGDNIEIKMASDGFLINSEDDFINLSQDNNQLESFTRKECEHLEGELENIKNGLETHFERQLGESVDLSDDSLKDYSSIAITLAKLKTRVKSLMQNENPDNVMNELDNIFDSMRSLTDNTLANNILEIYDDYRNDYYNEEISIRDLLVDTKELFLDSDIGVFNFLKRLLKDDASLLTIKI